jgi:hypothetical protein
MKSIPTRFLLRCAQYLIVGAALTAIAIIELHGAAPRASKVAIIALAVVAAGGGVFDGLARAWNEFMGPEAKQIDVEEPVKGLFLGILEETDLALTDVGLTVFAVLRSRRVFLRQVQWRIFRLRLESNPRPTHILWTKGKGVLGKCWRDGHWAGLDHAVHFRDAMDCQTRRDWKKLPKVVRVGLRWKDFKQIRDYEYVEAHPMIDKKGHYQGCLVIQVAKDRKGQIGQDRVRRLTERTCATIATVLAT